MFSLKFWTTLLYSIPSMTLYLLTVILLRRYPKEFSVTYAKLYIMFFVYNNITFFNSFITVRFPQNTCSNCTMSALFKAHSLNDLSWFPLNFFYFVHWNMAYSQFLMIFLTSLNRFTMIFWIKDYERIWNKAFVFVVIAAIAIPIPMAFPVFNATTYYAYSESLDCFTTGSSMDRDMVYKTLLTFMAVVTLLTAIVNIASFYQLSCMSTTIAAAERNLLFLSGAVFLVQLAAFVNTIFTRFFVNDGNKDAITSILAVTLLPYVSDGLTLIHPWLFLAFSSKARRRFVLMYWKNNSVSTGQTSIQLFSVTTRKSQVETNHQ